jgi:hypothetical protein
MFTIGLVLALISLSAATELPGFVNNTQCVFIPTTRTFTCQFGERKIECPAVANFTLFGPTTYHLFGIGQVPTTTGPTTTFPLYPRAFDNVTYVTGTVGTHTTVLYFGETFTHYGIRVTDPTCFGQIVQFFSTIADTHAITVGTTPVNLIGEILYSDSTVTKRWLWGYGFGLGYPFYGWGGWGGYGLGYGLGYGGFGYPGYWWGK